MIYGMRFVGSYYQGRNALEHFAEYALPYGDRLCLIGSKSALGAAREKIEQSFLGKDCQLHVLLTSGIPCEGEIQRVLEECRGYGPKAICGVGGGAVMDIARAVGNQLGTSLLMIPTACASDAPCTNVSVIYDEKGEQLIEARSYQKAPDLVYVDLDVMVQAPVRFLRSGMADALATWYEADVRRRKGTGTDGGFFATYTSMELARAARDIILTHGKQAYDAAQKGVITPDFEKVVEANVFLSGTAGLNTGCAAAHGIGDMLSALPGGHAWMHGERVGVGLVAMLILEGRAEQEIAEVVSFLKAVGLPCSIRELHMDVEETAEAIGVQAKEDHFFAHMTCDISKAAVRDALVAAEFRSP